MKTTAAPAIQVDSGATGTVITTDSVNTSAGTGPGYYDRGAYEFTAPLTATSLTVAPTPGGGPRDITATPVVTNPWNVPLTHTYDFRDGTPELVTTSTPVTRTLASPGQYCVYVSAGDGATSSWTTGWHDGRRRLHTAGPHADPRHPREDRRTDHHARAPGGEVALKVAGAGTVHIVADLFGYCAG